MLLLPLWLFLKCSYLLSFHGFCCSYFIDVHVVDAFVVAANGLHPQLEAVLELWRFVRNMLKLSLIYVPEVHIDINIYRYIEEFCTKNSVVYPNQIGGITTAKLMYRYVHAWCSLNIVFFFQERDGLQ